MSIINITDLTFAYDYEKIFDQVCLNLDTDWKLGLIGRNGKGKTTFLNLLLGKLEYTGKITTSVSFSYFPFIVEDKEINTYDIIDQVDSNIEQWRVLKELNLLKVKEDVLYRPFSTLSNGEQTKVLLAILFSKENNFLLIDEPTNHLDIDSREVVSKYLNTKSGFILVSHDREFLDSCVDHIVSINNTNIEVQKGNFSSWKENKDRTDQFEQKENERLQGDISRLQEASKRNENWSGKIEDTKYGTKNSGLRPDRGYIGHQSAKMMKRAKVTEKRTQTAIEEKKGLLNNIDRMDSLTIKPLRYDKNEFIAIHDLSIQYEQRSILQGISFDVRQEERVAIIGKNGSGKSSILKLIAGEEISYTGILKKGNNLKISYVKQDTSDLTGNLKDFAKKEEIEESIFKAMLNKLGFDTNDYRKDIKEFSAGQKKKVLIAKSISESAHLYIWDEPLNFIDIISRMQIEEAILKYMPTIIFVEHDKTFVKNIATKVIEI